MFSLHFDQGIQCRYSPLAFPRTGPIAQAWIFGCVALLLAAIAYRGSLFELIGRWTAQEEYSHGFLIPLVDGVAALDRVVDVLLASIAQPAWTGSRPYPVAQLFQLHVIGAIKRNLHLSPT